MSDQQPDGQPVADLSAAAQVDPDQPRDFSAFVLELNRGRTHSELSRALREVNEGVQEHGKAGKITLTLKVAPRDDADGQVLVSDEVKVEVPTANRKPTTFFTSRDGDLVRDNPQQFGFEGGGMPRPRDGR